MMRILSAFFFLYSFLFENDSSNYLFYRYLKYHSMRNVDFGRKIFALENFCRFFSLLKKSMHTEYIQAEWWNYS